MAAFDQLIGGIDFGEGPRWHEGRLWYSDFYQQRVCAVTLDGDRETMLEIDDRPSGLGWMPDGSLLVVSMTARKVLRATEGEVTEHADLSDLVPAKCNDMVVDASGRAYVGNFGFDLEAGGELATTGLVLVQPDGSSSLVAEDLFFPNGAVITPDGSTLIVGETFGGRYTAFTVGVDGVLTDRREWAQTPGMAPDGCTLDAAGGIWFSDAGGSRVVRVEEGGRITDELPTPQPTYACTLGGSDGRTLFVLTAPGSHPDQVAGVAGGTVLTTTVEMPHAGLP